MHWMIIQLILLCIGVQSYDVCRMLCVRHVNRKRKSNWCRVMYSVRTTVITGRVIAIEPLSGYEMFYTVLEQLTKRPMQYLHSTHSNSIQLHNNVQLKELFPESYFYPVPIEWNMTRFIVLR